MSFLDAPGIHCSHSFRSNPEHQPAPLGCSNLCRTLPELCCKWFSWAHHDTKISQYIKVTITNDHTILQQTFQAQCNEKHMIHDRTVSELTIILGVILPKIHFDYQCPLFPVWPWQSAFQSMHLSRRQHPETKDKWAQKIILRVTLFRKPLSIFYGPRCEAYMWKSP